MIPGIHTQPNAKISKASIMIKATGYIKLLQNDRVRMEEEIETLRSEVNLLKGSINDIQQQLPETGVPVTQLRNEDVTKKFNSWVKERSKRTWKFYLFGPVIRQSVLFRNHPAVLLLLLSITKFVFGTQQ